MDEELKLSLVGAILLLESEPVEEERLATLTGLPIEEVYSTLHALSVEYENPMHGFKPVKSGGGWIFAPKIEVWEVLKDHYGKKNESKLSRAAMETLSIIAYSQPNKRGENLAKRGVMGDGMVRYLIARGFIQESGKKDIPGKPMQYGTTQDFLKYFKLGSISELPKLGDIEKSRFQQVEGTQG